MSTISYVTEEGLRKLREELVQLESIERPRISKQIADARDKGDLSENAEYDAAKDAQGMLEMRIGKLKDVISNCRVIDETKLNTSKVRLLNKVKVKNLKNNAITTYMVVSESEANLKEGKISVETPIAKGLLGKKKGDKVEIKVPSGVVTLQIMEISL